MSSIFLDFPALRPMSQWRPHRTLAHMWTTPGGKWRCELCKADGSGYRAKEHVAGAKHAARLTMPPAPPSVAAVNEGVFLPPLPPLPESLPLSSLPTAAAAANTSQQQSLPPSTSSGAAHALLSLGAAPATISPLDLAPSIQFPSVRALIIMFDLRCSKAI